MVPSGTRTVARSGRLRRDWREDVADAGMGNTVAAGVEMSSVDLDFSAGHGCRWRKTVELGAWAEVELKRLIRTQG